MRTFLTLTLVLLGSGCSESPIPSATVVTTDGREELAADDEFAVMLASVEAEAERQSQQCMADFERSEQPDLGSQEELPRGEFIEALGSSDWHVIARAAVRLEQQPETSIPLLIEMLKCDQPVKLTKTVGLIYPGVRNGIFRECIPTRIINHDIDWLPIRAGWVLEAITFQDFGFSNEAFHRIKAKTEENQSTERPGSVLAEENDASLRKQLREQAIARVREWWQSRGSNWSRLTGLKVALESKDLDRVRKTLYWMRYYRTPIKGLSREYYIDNLYPIICRIAETADNQDVVTTAQMFVDDFANDNWIWLEQSPVDVEPARVENVFSSAVGQRHWWETATSETHPTRN